MVSIIKTLLVIFVAWWVSKYLRRSVYFRVVDEGSSDAFAEQLNASYDYIVVGAGSAGAVIASRLSEDDNVTVLLIEAGGDDRSHPYIPIPGLAPILANDPSISSIIYSEPDKRYTGLRNGQLKWPRGSTLGGSSSINYMCYVRGSRHDFDRWSAYTGDQSWSYSHVLPYFLKSERMLNPELAEPYHSTNGLLGVTRSFPLSHLANLVTEAAHELGFKHNEDYNGKTMEGVSPTQHTQENGERCSTSRAFLHPALERKNLHVVVYGRVRKVIIKNKQAEGVDMILNAKKFQIKATKEVVLSAGAMGSPQILLLSGIGPKAHLKEMGIPEVADLPVGKNLMDHPFYDIAIALDESAIPKPESLMSDWSFLQYKMLSSGPLSSLGVDLMMFTSVNESHVEKGWPELLIAFFTQGMFFNSDFLSAGNVDEDLVKELSYRNNMTNGIGCLPFLLLPRSRGELKLRSSDPFDDLLIYPNNYDKVEDIDTMIRGVEICKSLAESKALSGVGAKWVDSKPLTICNEYELDSKDYWSCMIRSRPRSGYHLTGTCKMGPTGDPSAVVDSQLRVKGVKGLRVADASIMPYIVAANTNAATIMIGEKAADMIRGQQLDPLDNL